MKIRKFGNDDSGGSSLDLSHLENNPNYKQKVKLQKLAMSLQNK